MRYDPLQIATAAMFFISATEQPWEEICIFFGGNLAGGWEGNGMGVGEGRGEEGNHLIIRRTEGVIIRNWEPKREIIEEELEELNSDRLLKSVGQCQFQSI